MNKRKKWAWKGDRASNKKSKKEKTTAGGEGDADAHPRQQPNAEEGGVDSPERQNRPRVPKKTYAIAFGYLGTDFHGLQFQFAGKGAQQSVPTVEGTLLQAIHKSGGVSAECLERPSALKWTRASRTDKGVHAVGQLVSLRTDLGVVAEDEAEDVEPPTDDGAGDTNEHSGEDGELAKRMRENQNNFIVRLNSNLPSSIRAFGMWKVGRAFDARTQCGDRRYEYAFPPFLIEGSRKSPKNGSKKSESGSEKAQEEKLSGILKGYLGTKPYHNFTRKMNVGDPSAMRHIKEVAVKHVVIDEVPLVVVTIVGQSFLLNQIRKMIGLAVEEFRESAGAGSVVAALEAKSSYRIRAAPAEGLLLDRLAFDGYNESPRVAPPFSCAIEWSDEMQEAAEEFKRQIIYPEIAKSVKTSDVWTDWLESVDEEPFASQLASGGGSPTGESDKSS